MSKYSGKKAYENFDVWLDDFLEATGDWVGVMQKGLDGFHGFSQEQQRCHGYTR